MGLNFRKDIFTILQRESETLPFFLNANLKDLFCPQNQNFGRKPLKMGIIPYIIGLFFLENNFKGLQK